ncbi:glutamine--fructose-6-phosphate transaminase (isomerizing) [Youngiibacter multivorans]|uniref:Glutamine--fructose-6-phosphate aminotransferase [isomerizing] n=1 Tax=Youngiibacter multivorans TaxID=937251 RepID=A0ABS4G4M4_9CLOT|nr:glutamine--fructose-6-phosphate transaminase (isomerizing) [Youngiibacter multivorans]MBP1919494.1 glucosamine--fructose-6-phosphate aminotransferase (isomerizing) [Youngiibacter multivorans]
MCGIVGYLGGKDATDVLVHGLSKLEYRGYDSAGIAVPEDGKITIVKTKGRLKNLAEKLETEPAHGHLGIGHTRWATHGEPSDVNSHPHCSNNDRISVVHNGIIENYMEIKSWLADKGYTFLSETDTEVIPNLVDHYFDGCLLEAVINATQRLKGSYALGVISLDDPDKIIAVRKDSPLIIGLGENESFIASDVPAILNYTREVVYLDDMEFAEITGSGIKYYNANLEPVEKSATTITWNADSAEKGGFDHFTIKEIHEQPKALRDTMTSRIVAGQKVKLDDITITKEMLESYSRIYIVACGTAYNAGVVGKTAIESLAKIPVEVDVASEFRYRDPIIDSRTLLIVISQSGETADTLAVLRDSKKKGARVIAITNVVGSSVAREATDVFYTWAGPEIGVASTKAYLTMLIAVYTIALHFAELLGTMTDEETDVIKKEMLLLPDKVSKVIEQKENIQKFALKIHGEKDVFFIGRGLDYAVAIEAALKLKELTYIHADAYPGGELKHGPIALIEKNTSVLASLTQRSLMDKMHSNLKEVTSRGAKVMVVTYESNKTVDSFVDTAVHIPETIDLLAPVLAVVPMQLLSYYVCSFKGLDVDKPRNLAKSVTVE